MLTKSYDELFHCKLFKKKFIGQAVRYVYVFETHMVINKVLISYLRKRNPIKKRQIEYSNPVILRELFGNILQRNQIN